ncbi:hypothetical protein [Chryseobacterium sp. WX]|uniref:hypothetical protein n=1 Tax=Chryseobacterium sp. WX TaxID=3031803 RepID=UPI00240A8FB8|nr:hypothetical protein [Chryseobacterium sp. WX]WFB69108.1 hypothetical protein PZ898_06720 [Chryseobacterium sp. WX]
MTYLQQEFTIHPVGQGLFYSGKISYQNKVKFRMVFDCGSLTADACKEEIEIYRDSDFLGEKIIDLLVISHFDADHVNKIGILLRGDIKIKKLVMPFLTFKERLFLVLHYFSDKTFDPDDDFFLQFAIDPLATIDQNLGDGSELILVEPDPNGPIGSDQNTIGELSESISIGLEKRFEFDFKGKKAIQPNEDPAIIGSKIKSFKVFDSEKGMVYAENLKLMEFIFYRRKVTANENDLYDEISRLFYEKFDIDTKLPKQEVFKATTEVIKKITSGTVIKEIFREAKKKINVKGVNIEDLNTTALSLLHRNLPDILKLGQSPYRNSESIFLDMDAKVYTIHKFVDSRLETPLLANHHGTFNVQLRKYSLIFPNVLLTSDSFLLKEKDIDPFIRHYENYWNKFWLFQIPHHGSEKNSDGILHSHLRSIDHCFINYGLGNRDNHPSSTVIHNLIATGNSQKIIPVNQTLGLRFQFLLRN